MNPSENGVLQQRPRNPGSRGQIRGFRWRNSHPFRWNSQQLMDLGLMEPGQWF
ncbi:hypothetical protein [Paracoccus pantotrophus]|uniref:hypothetical protein n=1 Tax=Paracoccus pantotrophus TaxID=82367 RepID=UPI0015F04F62|nr:hypothetical protein [Paracoccus pantotrophus]